MAKSKKRLAKEARAAKRRKVQKAARVAHLATKHAAEAAEKAWIEVIPVALGGLRPYGTVKHAVTSYFHWAGSMFSEESDAARKCHDLYGRLIGEEMAGSLSEFAAPRVKWARACVFCTCSLKEREAQNFARVDVPGAQWTAAWKEAIIYRPDGFRVCWVCAGDFKAVEVDPMTAPLPEGISTAQAPQKDEPFKVPEWTAGRSRGQAAGR